MKCYLKSLRYSLYLMVLLAVAGCSNNPLPSILKNKNINITYLFNKAFKQSDTFSVLIQTSPDKAEINYKSVENVKQIQDIDLNSVSEPSNKTEFPEHNYSFALQLMSVESEQSLAYSFKKMVKRAPNIFQGKPILNIEVAKVNEHTYYRLKFGRYKYLKNAKADCEAIKRQGIDCWVGNYTDNRIYF